MLVFCKEALLAPRTPPKLEDHSLSSVRYCLSNTVRSWCSELSSGIYYRVKLLSTDVQRCVLPPSSGMSEPSTKDRGLYRSPVPRWSVMVRDDRLGTGQWQWVVGPSRRERYIGRGCQVDAIQPLEGPHWKPGMVNCWIDELLYCIHLTSSPDIPLSLFYLNLPPTAIGRFLAYRLSPRLAN
jgi:hypothetical protein